MAVLNKLEVHAHFLLRIALASVFIYHGWSKLSDISGFAQMMGLPTIVAALVTAAEILGGVGILAGGLMKNDLITRLSGLVIVPVMLGAIFLVHWPRWNFMISESHPAGGMEFQVVLLLIALYFLIVGNGVSAKEPKIIPKQGVLT
ncbi:MAG: DoxX family protein [Gammaproteobacteria bacterium]|nr:DoxX family protein [Gammaproteobacteria bacterium]